MPAVTKGFVAMEIMSPSSGATMSTDIPGEPGSEIVATTSPSRIMVPSRTKTSSRPPSLALSQREPEASKRNAGRVGRPGIIFRERSTLSVPSKATLTADCSKVSAAPPS